MSNQNPKLISAAKAFVIDNSGNFLCLYRSGTHPTHPHWPDLAGGLIDENEQPYDALVREMHEECQVDIAGCEYKLIYAASEVPEKFENTSISRLFYIIKLDKEKPTVVLSWEHEKYEWLPLEHILELEFEEFVEDAKKYILKNKISLNV